MFPVKLVKAENKGKAAPLSKRMAQCPREACSQAQPRLAQSIFISVVFRAHYKSPSEGAC